MAAQGIGAQTYSPGSVTPDYVLLPPVASRDGALQNLTVYAESLTVASEEGIPLSSVLVKDMGCIDWAACTSYYNR